MRLLPVLVLAAATAACAGNQQMTAQIAQCQAAAEERSGVGADGAYYRPDEPGGPVRPNHTGARGVWWAVYGDCMRAAGLDPMDYPQ